MSDFRFWFIGLEEPKKEDDARVAWPSEETWAYFGPEAGPVAAGPKALGRDIFPDLDVRTYDV